MHSNLRNERELGYGEGRSRGRGHHHCVPGSLELFRWFMGLQGFRRPGWFSQRHIYWSWNYSLFFLPFLLLPSVNIWTPGMAKLFSHSLGSFSPSVSAHSLTAEQRGQPPSLNPPFIFSICSHSHSIWSSLNKTVLFQRREILTFPAFTFNWKTCIAPSNCHSHCFPLQPYPSSNTCSPLLPHKVTDGFFICQDFIFHLLSLILLPFYRWGINLTP